jgi:hypothetical protein
MKWYCVYQKRRFTGWSVAANFWFVRFILLWYSQNFGGKMTLKKFKKLILTLIAAMLVISACVGADTSPTPTEISVEAIYTAGAATVFAGQTGTAGAQPTQTLIPTDTITPTGTITATPVPTRQIFVPVQPVYTAIVTITGTPWTLTPSITPTFGAVGCNNSAFIQDVTIPNNTKLNAGETFTKTWRIKNTGTCAWTAGYKFYFIGGQLFGSDTRKIRSAVSVGGTIDISLNMVAPNSPGTYSSYWRMTDEAGQLFGTSFSVVIIVPGATFTPTSAVTATTAPATATPVTPSATAVPPTETSIPPTTYPNP